MRNGKIANIPIKRKELFGKWLELTKPFHNLPNHHCSTLALLLYYYDKYKNELGNEDVAWKMVFDLSTKMMIKKELGIKDGSFQNLLSSLRAKGIIENNKVVTRYIPNVEKGAEVFKIVFNFKLINDESKT